MDYNLIENIEYCGLIVDEFRSLLLYSHIPSAAIALIIGLAVFWRNRHSLLAIILLTISVLFAAWSFADLAIWLNYHRSAVVMSAWAPIELFSVLMFVFCLYFVYVFTDKKDVGWRKKSVWALLILPMLVLTPTVFNLESYDLQECIAVENSSYIQYFLWLKIIFSGWIIFALVQKYLQASQEFRKQIFILGLGMIIFIASFFGAGFASDQTLDYTYEMYGLFAMIAFMTALAYLIVKFKTFNLKVFGAQVLLIALVILISSQFLFVQNDTNRALVSVTLIFTGLIGVNLLRSVKKEISLREQLQIANEGQADLLHIINHQIKGYMTKARLVFDDLISDPNYNLSESAKPMVKQGFDSVTEGVNFVQDFLNASNIERGTFNYEMKPIDFKSVVAEQAERQKSAAADSKLTYEVQIEDGDYNMTADQGQVSQAVRNLIDNSIKYTPQGGLWIKLERKDNKAIFSIKDTGVGISEELRPRLFTKGGRDKDSQKINVQSTGFGLAFVKGVAEAHKGRVWADSLGHNKGATFYMELPLNS